eukprot:9490261-Pyramimonas_sp.AAC.1
MQHHSVHTPPYLPSPLCSPEPLGAQHWELGSGEPVRTPKLIEKSTTFFQHPLGLFSAKH